MAKQATTTITSSASSARCGHVWRRCDRDRLGGVWWTTDLGGGGRCGRLGRDTRLGRLGCGRPARRFGCVGRRWGGGAGVVREVGHERGSVPAAVCPDRSGVAR